MGASELEPYKISCRPGDTWSPNKVNLSHQVLLIQDSRLILSGLSYMANLGQQILLILWAFVQNPFGRLTWSIQVTRYTLGLCGCRTCTFCGRIALSDSLYNPLSNLKEGQANPQYIIGQFRPSPDTYQAYVAPLFCLALCMCFCSQSSNQMTSFIVIWISVVNTLCHEYQS